MVAQDLQTVDAPGPIYSFFGNPLSLRAMSSLTRTEIIQPQHNFVCLFARIMIPWDFSISLFLFLLN